MAIYESWDPIAVRLGFNNEAEMLKAMYVDQGLSIQQMIKKLGYAQNSIRTRLKEAGVNLKPRGGPNAQGKTILKSLTNEELLKLKPVDLLNAENPDGSRKYNCTPNTLYKEKRRRNLICSTPVSRQQPISNNTPEEGTSNSVSPKSPCEMLSISNGIEEDENSEIL
jgi:hypothetical protein